MGSASTSDPAVGMVVGHSEPFGCAQAKLREESVTPIPGERLRMECTLSAVQRGACTGGSEPRATERITRINPSARCKKLRRARESRAARTRIFHCAEGSLGRV